MKNTNYIKMSKLRLTIAMLALGAGWAIVYLVPYLQYTWYEPFREFLDISGTKMSFLLSIYGHLRTGKRIPGTDWGMVRRPLQL